MSLLEGMLAPDFLLDSHLDKTIQLSDYSGKKKRNY